MTKSRNDLITTLPALLLMLISLISGCANPPHPTEKSYWQIVAEDHMHNGLQYYQRQQFRQAMNQFGRALKTYQRFNNIEGELNSRINLAKAGIALNQLESASSQIDEARRLITGHGMDDKTVHLDIMASSIALQGYALDAAEDILDEYPGEAVLPRDVSAALLVNKIRLAFLRRDDVTSLLDRLAGITANQPAYRPRLLRFQARRADEQQRFEDSDALYGRALSQYRNDADAMGVMSTLREWGESFALRGEWSEAEMRFRDMYKAAASVKLQYRMVEALQELVLVYRKLGDWERVEWAQGRISVLDNI